MGNETARERIASILDSQYRADHAMYLDEHDETADAVIAHLWQQAESSEVIEAVVDAIFSAPPKYEHLARAATTAMLTALIGDKPEGTDHAEQ